jgi:hypothetical protein
VLPVDEGVVDAGVGDERREAMLVGGGGDDEEAAEALPIKEIRRPSTSSRARRKSTTGAITRSSRG